MLISNILDSLSLILPFKSYEPEKICLISKERGKCPLKVQGILLKIALSDSEYQKTLLKRLQNVICKNEKF